jgi:hypothetical protein
MLEIFFRFFALRFSLTFATAFFIGIAANALTGNYQITVTFDETFTKAEVESLLDKKVSDKCFQSPAENTGTIVSHGIDDFSRTRFIEIKWKAPIAGKHETTIQGKEFFERCLILEEAH